MEDHFQNVGTAFAKYQFAIKKGVFIENRFNPENCRIRRQLRYNFSPEGGMLCPTSVPIPVTGSTCSETLSSSSPSDDKAVLTSLRDNCRIRRQLPATFQEKGIRQCQTIVSQVMSCAGSPLSSISSLVSKPGVASGRMVLPDTLQTIQPRQSRRKRCLYVHTSRINAHSGRSQNFHPDPDLGGSRDRQGGLQCIQGGLKQCPSGAASPGLAIRPGFFGGVFGWPVIRLFLSFNLKPRRRQYCEQYHCRSDHHRDRIARRHRDPMTAFPSVILACTAGADTVCPS